MKITILFIVFCLGISAALGQVTAPVSNNDAPATKAQVEKLFGVMDIRQQTRNMMGSMQQQMQVMTNQTIKSRYPEITPAQMARMNRISSETLKDFPVDGMLDDMIPIYQKHLTQADVDAMIVFYSSPTGKKLMQQMPQITQEAMQASYKRMQKQIDAAVQRVEDMAKEEQQEKQQQKDNPPSTPAPKQD
jgi:uncharacterized protein